MKRKCSLLLTLMFALVLMIFPSLVSADDASDSTVEYTNSYTTNSGENVEIPVVSDNSKRVYDFADVLSDDQSDKLESSLTTISSRIDGDAVLLITDKVPEDADYGTDTSMQYATQFYMDNGFADNGFIFLIDLNNRVLWLAGSGDYATQKYADLGDKIQKKTSDKAADGDYYSVAEYAVDQLDRIGNIPRAMIPTFPSFLISAAASLIVILIFVLHHSKTQPSKVNTPEVAVEHYKTLDHDEQYLGTTVVRHKIEHDDHSDGGDSSSGVSSGGFSGDGGDFSGGGGHF